MSSLDAQSLTPVLAPGAAPLLTFSDTRDVTHPPGALRKQSRKPLETWGAGCQEVPLIPGNQGTEGREQLVERPASLSLCAPGLVWACAQARSCKYAIGAGPGAGMVHRGLKPWRAQTSSHRSPACPHTRQKDVVRQLRWEGRCRKGARLRFGETWWHSTARNNKCSFDARL